MKIGTNGREINQESYLDVLVGLTASTEMMSSQAAEDGLVLPELFKTNLTRTNTTLEGSL